jgi:hypothetical protein
MKQPIATPLLESDDDPGANSFPADTNMANYYQRSHRARFNRWEPDATTWETSTMTKHLAHAGNWAFRMAQVNLSKLRFRQLFTTIYLYLYDIRASIPAPFSRRTRKRTLSPANFALSLLPLPLISANPVNAKNAKSYTRTSKANGVPGSSTIRRTEDCVPLLPRLWLQVNATSATRGRIHLRIKSLRIPPANL